MEISLLTLLIGLALGTFALGFIFARLAKLSRLSSPAHQFAAEGAHASAPATPEPEDVLTATQLHYQQTHINSLNTSIRLLEEKLRWAEQDRQDAEDAMADLQHELEVAKEPRGDEVTQREAELALLRAQLDAAINNVSKLERKAIRAEHDAHAAREENQQLRSKLWAQQSTDVALSRLQDRQTALQAAVNENQITRDRLAGEVVTLNAALAEREALLAERDAMLTFADRKLREKEDDYAGLVARENAWEKQQALLVDTQAQVVQAERERDEALCDVTQLRIALDESGAQIQLVSERLHALHEAMALRDAQVTELHGELRRLQLEHAATSEHRDALRDELMQTIAGAAAREKELRAALARTVSAAEETRMMLRLRESAVADLEERLVLAEQQRETLEAALLLATANLTTLREERNDAEASRMLLEADLENKTQALAIATDDLAQLSSREYELTVALERTGREHQSSFETMLLHLNKVEDEMAKAQAELAEKREEIAQLAGQLHEVEIALQRATQQAQEKDGALAALDAALQKDEAALTVAQKQVSEQDDEISALLLARNTLETHLQAKSAVLATAEAVIASMREQMAERDQALADLRILVNERGRELESAHAQVAYLTDGLDDLNNTANEKFVALQAAQTALNAAQTANELAQVQITQLTNERNALASEVSAAQQQLETLRDENAGLVADLSAARANAAQLQTEFDEARAQIAQVQVVNATLSETVEAQAGEIIALAKAKDQLEGALKLAEARVADLALALENAGARQTDFELRLQETTAALETLRDEYAALLEAKTAGDAAVHSLNEALAALDVEKIALESRVQDSEAALEALRGENAALLEAKAAGHETVKSLTEALAALEAEKAVMEARLQDREAALATLQGEHAALLEAKAASDETVKSLTEAIAALEAEKAALEAQLQEGIVAFEVTRRQNETTIAQTQTHIAELTSASEMAAGERLALETALRECEGRLEQMTVSLTELRQAHASLLQEHDALRRAGDALESQTRHQMETLVEISNASALLQQQLQERDAALLATQVTLAQAQQALTAKPEPGTLEANLIDTTLTLQRLEREFAALQAEKDAIEDEYTRAQIAGQMRMTEKEHELRECGARVDVLELEVALMKAKNS